MRIEEARAIAAAWVGTVGGEPPVVGAFCTGSTVAADPASELGPWSDVDLVLVVEGEAPAKLGKLRFRGVLLDVSYLPWSVLADHEVVARTFYLAPSFATDTVLSDPDGRLRRLADQVGRLVARPDVVRDRYEDVLSRLVAAPRPAASWAAAVTGWLFPASLSTNVVLVAAGRNPTVRLRYLRAREVLTAAGMPEVYQRLLERLGCAETTRAQVAAQLLPLTTAFEPPPLAVVRTSRSRPTSPRPPGRPRWEAPPPWSRRASTGRPSFGWWPPSPAACRSSGRRPTRPRPSTRSPSPGPCRTCSASRRQRTCSGGGRRLSPTFLCCAAPLRS